MNYRLTTKTAPTGFLALLTASVIGVAPLQAQTPPAAGAGPKGVLSQTIRGVTVTLSDKQWSTKDSFRFSYIVQADSALSLPPGKSLLDFVTGVMVTAPDGSLADAHAEVFSTDSTQARTMALVSTRDVDPRWPVLGVDIDVMDPAAPPLGATESSEQMRDDSFYHHFHLLLPLKALYTASVRTNPPLTKQGKDLVGQIDFLGWQWDRYHLRMLLRDRTDPSVRWQLQSLQATDDAGNALIGRAPKGDDFFWKTDGTPLVSGETALETYLGGAGSTSVSYGVTPPVPAKTLTLTVQAEALRPQEHILDFTALPFPADGQTLTLSKTVSDAFGGKLTLEKIVAYSPAHPLPPGVAARIFPLVLASSGLALLIAEPPSMTATTFDYQFFAANDTTGRHLRPVSTAFHGAGDALSDTPLASGAPRMVALFLRLPTPGAKAFNLRMGRTEQIDLHRSETLVFPAIPAPPKPPAP